MALLHRKRCCANPPPDFLELGEMKRRHALRRCDERMVARDSYYTGLIILTVRWEGLSLAAATIH